MDELTFEDYKNIGSMFLIYYNFGLFIESHEALDTLVFCWDKTTGVVRYFPNLIIRNNSIATSSEIIKIITLKSVFIKCVNDFMNRYKKLKIELKKKTIEKDFEV
jgi:hypothetical protein